MASLSNACFLVLIFLHGCLCLCFLLSDVCVASPTGEAVSMRLKLIHLYSSESPSYDPSVTPAQKLSNLMQMDILRSTHLQLTSMMKAQHRQHRQEEFLNVDSPRSNVFSGVSLGLGQYMAEIFLGSPAQRFLLIIDTGSDLVWVQCSPCHGCSPLPAATFLPQKSSTFLQLSCSSEPCFLVPAPPHDTCNTRYPSGCRYLYRYADDSSSSGILCSDAATLNSTSGRRVQFPGIVFGCGSRNAGSFKSASGVLGLGQGAISFASQIKQTYNRFSYCLGDYLRSTISTSLIFFSKAADYQPLKSGLHITPLVSNSLLPTFYYVKIKEVSVGGEGALPIPGYVWEIDLLGNGGTIIDTGSTLSVFKSPAYSLILAAFERSIRYPRAPPVQGLDLCFNVSGISLPQPLFPAFSITFDGFAAFQPPPSNYFIEVADGVRCLAIQGNSSPFAFNTIGNLLQQNFLMQFDPDNSQLGFAQANCSEL